MIRDTDEIKPLLVGERAEIIVAEVDGMGRTIGLHMKHGHIAIREDWALPVVNGYTSSLLFVDNAAGKCERVLAAPLRESGEIHAAVFMPGSQNYYHFLMFNLPALLLLGDRADSNLKLLTVHGFPPSMDKLVRDTVIPQLAGGRAVEIVRMSAGDYAARDVAFRIIPPTSISVLMARMVRKIVWAKAGLKNPLAELGGLKLFVLRGSGAHERLLQNQDEVQAWFEARGYTAIDPGALTIEQQIIVFSRATHIAGVEGAAFANLLFTVAAPHVVLFANPLAIAENFFPGITRKMGMHLDMMLGQACADKPTRNSNFTLPLERLEEYERGAHGNPAWLKRYDPK